MIKKYNGYYDVSLQLLKTRDQNNFPPQFFISCTTYDERGAGKTFSTANLLLQNYFEKGKKLENIIDHPDYKARSGQFILFTRRIGDLGNIAKGVLDATVSERYPDYTIEEVLGKGDKTSRIDLVHYEEFTPYDKDGNPKEPEQEKITETIGYVIPLNIKMDYFKRTGNQFYNIDCFYFDEFQPEDESYLPDEIGCLVRIYETIARGKGEVERYIPIILTSNTVAVNNPYFKYTGLSRNIQSNTRFYRGDGVVYERPTVTGLSEKRKNSYLHRSLAKYFQETGDNTFINDDGSLVEHPDKWGRGLYLAALKVGPRVYGLYEYPQKRLFYVSRSIDPNNKYIYSLYIDNHQKNTPLLKTSPLLRDIRDHIYEGRLRVADQQIQNDLLDYFS